MATENQLFANIDSFEHKVAQLVGHVTRLSNRIKSLEDDNTNLRSTIRDQEKQIKELQKKQPGTKQSFTNSKEFGKIVVNNLADTATSTEIKQRLDEYIQEIERCIEYLSTLS